jgi:hypothetical protein
MLSAVTNDSNASPAITCVPVAPEHKGRGYEVGKGQYLIVEDEELDAIEIESTHTIEIDRFVPRQQIDQRFFDTTYYFTPHEPVATVPIEVKKQLPIMISLCAAVDYCDETRP